MAPPGEGRKMICMAGGRHAGEAANTAGLPLSADAVVDVADHDGGGILGADLLSNLPR